jgi:ABC-type multidrug transport system fused ATPase/permease subunit
LGRNPCTPAAQAGRRDRDGRPAADPRVPGAAVGKLSRGARTTRVLIYRVKFFLTFLGNFIDAVGSLIVLALGGYLVLQGKAEVGTLVVFISGFLKVADPWNQLLTFYRTTSNTRTKYRLIVDTLPAGKA